VKCFFFSRICFNIYSYSKWSIPFDALKCFTSI